MNERIDYDKVFDIGFEDEESKKLFDHIMHSRLFGDEESFLDGIAKICSHDWYSWELDRAMEAAGARRVILYGAGHDGRINRKVLDLCGIPLKCFCDRDPDAIRKRDASESFAGAEVISDDQLPEAAADDALIVISSRKYSEEIRERILSRGIPGSKILIPKDGVLTAGTSRQYFDVFEPEEGEVFVDGGAYRGETSRFFTEWARSGYKKIFAFEPCVSEEDAFMAKDISALEWMRCALWDKDEQLKITGAEEGSRVHAAGPAAPEEFSVRGVPLDDIAGSERVTFIKLDVEGSEMKALMGAENIIRRDLPKLAVSVYHRPEDIIEIPKYLRSIAPQYRFWLRHYHTDSIETILYCSI